MRNMLIGVALLAGVGTVAANAGLGAGPRIPVSAAMGYGSNGDCNPRYEDCYYGGDRRYENRRSMRRCTEGRALDKAERMGIRRARHRNRRQANHRSARARPLRRSHLRHIRPPVELPNPELTRSGFLGLSPSARGSAFRRRPYARR